MLSLVSLSMHLHLLTLSDKEEQTDITRREQHRYTAGREEDETKQRTTNLKRRQYPRLLTRLEFFDYLRVTVLAISLTPLNRPY
jgi:hypothetical protein